MGSAGAVAGCVCIHRIFPPVGGGSCRVLHILEYVTNEQFFHSLIISTIKYATFISLLLLLHSETLSLTDFGLQCLQEFSMTN